MTGFWDGVWDLLQNFGGSVSELIDKVQTVDPTARALLAGTAAMFETNVITGLLVPGDTVMLVASAAVQSPREGFLLGVLVSLGAFIGEVTGYWLGRWVGPTLHRRRWLRRRAGEQRIGPVGRMVERRGGPWILTSRFIPVLRTVTPFVVGVHAFPFRRFVAWAAPSCILWSATYISIYAMASSSLRSEDGSPVVGAVLALLGAVLFGAAVLAQFLIERRHRRQRVQEADAA
ncbi:DedA family protein [Nocardioides sp. HDW12B]|uniref:DedA family protein n=1 Tax=Nocardioides sp. HDW12B TaxID=2714939 RepID=UPI001409DEC3|nr:DedA family protein [Nocardioides sp. HDW12B]QIK67373.1 DedA family protein [Nocardioides sp. HDW12B]